MLLVRNLTSSKAILIFPFRYLDCADLNRHAESKSLTWGHRIFFKSHVNPYSPSLDQLRILMVVNRDWEWQPNHPQGQVTGTIILKFYPLIHALWMVLPYIRTLYQTGLNSPSWRQDHHHDHLLLLGNLSGALVHKVQSKMSVARQRGTRRNRLNLGISCVKLILKIILKCKLSCAKIAAADWE